MIDEVRNFVKSVDVDSFAAKIDHTVLDPGKSVDEIVEEVRRASTMGFACIVVPPHLVPQIRSVVGGRARLCSVVGFPMGFQPIEIKVCEARWLLEHGAEEIDAVVNLQRAKAGDLEYVAEEVRALREVVDRYGATLKIIIETGVLSTEQMLRIARVVAENGAHFVKTCTGFLGGRATIQHVAMLRKVLPPNVGVKASGGIRTVIDAVALILAGADRLGTSAGISLIEQYRSLREAVERGW